MSVVGRAETPRRKRLPVRDERPGCILVRTGTDPCEVQFAPDLWCGWCRAFAAGAGLPYWPEQTGADS